MSTSDRHNALATEFVTKVLRQTESHGELMVVVESVLLAAMLGANRLYGVAPGTSVEMVEMAVQQATERLAGKATS